MLSVLKRSDFLFLFLVQIASNDSLEYLDLSWNHLRRKGAMEVAAGLRVTIHELS